MLEPQWQRQKTDRRASPDKPRIEPLSSCAGQVRKLSTCPEAPLFVSMAATGLVLAQVATAPTP